MAGSENSTKGLPAGELLHGPNALVDNALAVVVLATRDTANPDAMLRYQKTLTILEYVKRHGEKAIAIATEGGQEPQALVQRVLFVSSAPELLLPISEVVPLPLFAYHYAVPNGSDVDHPRNLLKAVATE
jgi:glucosamine--fructose-6-phosphate aminotransferase (isomerizing)